MSTGARWWWHLGEFYFPSALPRTYCYEIFTSFKEEVSPHYIGFIGASGCFQFLLFFLHVTVWGLAILVFLVLGGFARGRSMASHPFIFFVTVRWPEQKQNIPSFLVFFDTLCNKNKIAFTVLIQSTMDGGLLLFFPNVLLSFVKSLFSTRSTGTKNHTHWGVLQGATLTFYQNEYSSTRTDAFVRILHSLGKWIMSHESWVICRGDRCTVTIWSCFHVTVMLQP